MGSDVEERGACARGGLEVDAEVPSLPAGRHVDRGLHLKAKKRGNCSVSPDPGCNIEARIPDVVHIQ